MTKFIKVTEYETQSEYRRSQAEVRDIIVSKGEILISTRHITFIRSDREHSAIYTTSDCINALESIEELQEKLKAVEVI